MFWNDGQEFMEALEGAFGEDEQQEALNFAEESGLLDAWLAEEAAEAGDEGAYDPELEAEHLDGEMTGGIENEMERLEASIGRKLTSAEERQLLQSIPDQNWHEGVVPDFGHHAEKLKGRASESQDERIRLMTEAADTAKEELAKPESEPEAPWMQGDTEAEPELAFD